MRTELRTFLLADAGLAAVVGVKVDWNLRLDGDRGAALVLILVDNPAGYTLAGRDGLEQAFITFECWGDTVAEAEAVANAVKVLADGRPRTGFRAFFLEGERDGSEYASPIKHHCISLDLRVWRQTA
jgi:hypothetical protein